MMRQLLNVGLQPIDTSLDVLGMLSQSGRHQLPLPPRDPVIDDIPRRQIKPRRERLDDVLAEVDTGSGDGGNVARPASLAKTQVPRGTTSRIATGTCLRLPSLLHRFAQLTLHEPISRGEACRLLYMLLPDL